ncbi:MAG: zinc metalloprotease HtpX [Candidatus Wallbacteria bacterium]
MNSLKLTAFMTALIVLFMTIGKMLGGHNGMMIALFISLGMNFFSYWFSDKIVLMAYGAQPLPRDTAPQIHEIIEKLADRARIPVPKVYIVNSGVPNAFATGRNPQNAAVAVTTGLLNILNLHEIEGVLAHELAHVINRDTLISTVVSSFVGAIYYMADMLRWAMIFGGSSRDDENGDSGSSALGYLFVIIVAPLIAMILQMAISRSREYKADYYGAKLAGDNAGLMSALIKLEQGNRLNHNFSTPATSSMCIVNPFSGRALFSLFSTHPATEDRLKELQKIQF